MTGGESIRTTADQRGRAAAHGNLRREGARLVSLARDRAASMSAPFAGMKASGWAGESSPESSPNSSRSSSPSCERGPPVLSATQGTTRTSVSATQAGLSAPASITYLAATTAPAEPSAISEKVTVARSAEPTRTGAGKRTLFTP
jgi:hypothetical protein